MKTKGFTCYWHPQRSRLRHHAGRSTSARIGSTILRRNRRWIRGSTLFKGTRQKGMHASYQWELSGPHGGDWWLIVSDGTYKMGRGKIPNPNVTFVASDEAWVAMSNKTLNVSLADLTGRLKIQGSHRLVKELDKIFP